MIFIGSFMGALFLSFKRNASLFLFIFPIDKKNDSQKQFVQHAKFSNAVKLQTLKYTMKIDGLIKEMERLSKSSNYT